MTNFTHPGVTAPGCFLFRPNRHQRILRENLMKPRLLKIGETSRATGVSIPTLCRWLDRRTIKPSRNDKPSTGTGDHRAFSRALINQIALAKKLMELGVGAGRSNVAAAHFTESSDNGRPANELFEFGLT